MNLYLLKFPYRKILLPAAQWLSTWLHPDIVSYMAVVIAALTGVCYYYAAAVPALLLWAVACTFLRMTLNTLDGVMAIERGNLTSRGEVVNALPDRYSDIFVLAGIALSPLCRPGLGLAAIASMFLVSYTGMLGKALGVSWQHHGPLGKVERLIFLMIFSVIQYIFMPERTNVLFLGITASPLEWAMLIFVILGQVTVVNRLRGQLRQMARKDAEEKFEPDRNICSALVVYDSMTGNTATVAREIANGLGCSSVPVSDCPDISSYVLVVLGTPNIRKEPTPAMQNFQKHVSRTPHQCAVFATYGMPVWGQISTPACLSHMARSWHIKTPGTIFLQRISRKI